MATNFNIREVSDLKLNEALCAMFMGLNEPIALFNTKAEVLVLNKALVRLLESLEIITTSKDINELLALLGDKKGLPAEAFSQSDIERPLTITIEDVRRKTIERFGPLVFEGDLLGGYIMIIDITDATDSFEERDRRLRDLVNNVGIGIVILNQEHQVIDTNARFAEMLGYTIDEMYDLHIWDWDADMSEAEIRESFKDLSGLKASFVTRHRRKDGSTYLVDINAYGALLEGNGKAYNASICVCRDITEFVEMQRKLELSEFRYRNLVENSMEIVLSMTEDSIIDYVSSNCEGLTGYLPAEIQGKQITDFITPEVFERIKTTLNTSLDSNSPTSFDLPVIHKDSSEHWYHVSFAPSLDIDGNKIFILHALNIDERKEYEHKLEYLSTHDQLTGTYNRRFFDTYFEKQFKSKKYPLSILVCDIDDLKSINDSQGHAKGDEAIKLCALAIQATLRRGDFLARLGGDEFVATLPDTGKLEALKIIDRIKQSINALNQENEDIRANLSVSIGYATALNEYCSIEELLKIADANMYAHKRED